MLGKGAGRPSVHVPPRQCCGSPNQLTPAEVIRPRVAEEIRRTHPDWPGDGFICREDLARFRSAQVQRLLESRMLTREHVSR